MSSKKPRDDIYKLKRYLGLAGLSSTIIAAILLVLFYRITAIGDIVELGERNNLVLAKTVLNSVKAELIQYITDDSHQHTVDEKEHPIPENLNKAIQEIMTNSIATRIKIYNKSGTIIFSTKPSQIGLKEPMNDEFLLAINGQVATKLIYHDTFNMFGERSDEDNLVQSYLPIRLDITSPVLGVFEIYTDVNFITNRIERTEVIILLGVSLILLLLYSFQAIIIHYSSRTIERQQSIIKERTKTLELLSTQMLNAQETEKKKISNLLHENLAQTLSIVMKNIEIEHSKQDNKNSNPVQDILPQSIQLLRNAIKEVRTLAIELRPPTLDDFGLIKTIESLCKEYRNLYPKLNIETSFDLNEFNIPTALKTLIYRVTQEAMAGITSNGNADNIIITLQKENKEIRLSIEDNAFSYHTKSYDPANDEISRKIYSAMKERTILSGGTFILEHNQQGKTIAESCWQT